jgi:hypothetical protein
MELLLGVVMHRLEVVTEVMGQLLMPMDLRGLLQVEEEAVENVVAFGSGARVVPAALVRTVKS